MLAAHLPNHRRFDQHPARARLRPRERYLAPEDADARFCADSLSLGGNLKPQRRGKARALELLGEVGEFVALVAYALLQLVNFAL